MEASSHIEDTLVLNNIIFISCDVQLPDDKIFLQQFHESVKIIIMIVSVVFNSTIISAVCLSKRLHTIQRVFVASLAVSDLINSCMAAITGIFQISECGSEQRITYMCVVGFITLYGLICNVLNLLLISVERWLYIARPFLHHRIVTRRAALISILFLWVVAGMVNLRVLVGQRPCDLQLARFNFGVIGPFSYFFLSLLMFSIHFHIALIARRQNRLINTNRSVGVFTDCQAVNISRTPALVVWKNVRLLVTVFGTFFILMTPGMCANIYVYARDPYFYGSVFGKISELMWCSHSLANFVIFAFRDIAFREVLKHWLQRAASRISCNKVHPENYGV